MVRPDEGLEFIKLIVKLYSVAMQYKFQSSIGIDRVAKLVEGRASNSKSAVFSPCVVWTHSLQNIPCVSDFVYEEM